MVRNVFVDGGNEVGESAESLVPFPPLFLPLPACTLSSPTRLSQLPVKVTPDILRRRSDSDAEYSSPGRSNSTGIIHKLRGAAREPSVFPAAALTCGGLLGSPGLLYPSRAVDRSFVPRNNSFPPRARILWTVPQISIAVQCFMHPPPFFMRAEQNPTKSHVSL